MQSPLSDQAGNLASNTGGAGTSRRTSASNTRSRPLSSDEINISLVMRMGFSRRAVELAVRTLSMYSKIFRSFLQKHFSLIFSISQNNKKLHLLLVAWSNG